MRHAITLASPDIGEDKLFREAKTTKKKNANYLSYYTQTIEKGAIFSTLKFSTTNILLSDGKEKMINRSLISNRKLSLLNVKTVL